MTLTGTTSETIVVLAGSTKATGPDAGRIRVPITMPSAQMYYWSAVWQNAEAESLADYESGEYVESGDPEEVIHWLDKPDGDQ